MIYATIRMTLPAQKVKEALEILHSVAQRTRVQPGCISCRVYHDVEEEDVIMIEDVWRSKEELDRHLRSPEYRNVLVVLEMALKKPEISFTPFSHSTGLETIEKARFAGRRGEKA